MLDIKFVRENPDVVRQNIRNKFQDAKLPLVEVKNEKLMFRIIRASFNQRRKTLVNGLKNSQEIPFSKEQIEQALGMCGLSLSVRGEALTLAQFAQLANAFTEIS